MKKIIKRSLWGVGILLLVITLVIVSFSIKIKAELKKMNPVETKEIVKNIYAVNDTFVNMYLVKDSDHYVAIDAGNNIESIKNQLHKLNIDPTKIIAVLLTHSDHDHVAAIPLFKNANVYLASAEEQMINGKTARVMGTYNKLPVKNYTLISDHQFLNLGGIKIENILTPGHTPGSMSYLINDKYLFVGDAFGLENGKIIKPNPMFTNDMPTAIRSFQKIKNLSHVTYIFTGHTGYTNNYRNAVNTNLK